MMNQLKKYLGVVWIILAPTVMIFLLLQAVQKIASAAEKVKANVALQWSIILLIFIPICIGFLIFGYYSFKGEYQSTSNDIADVN